jgi:hypothetical protein
MVAAGEHLSSSRPVRRAKTRPAARIPLCVEPPPSFAEGPGPGRDWWEKALSEKSFSGRKRGESPQNQGVGAKSRTTHLGPFGEVIRMTGLMAKLTKTPSGRHGIKGRVRTSKEQRRFMLDEFERNGVLAAGPEHVSSVFLFRSGIVRCCQLQ